MFERKAWYSKGHIYQNKWKYLKIFLSLVLQQILYIKSLVACVCLSVTTRRIEKWRERHKTEHRSTTVRWRARSWNPVSVYRGPKTQVLRARSWEPNAATRQQQKKRVAAPNRTCMASKIRDDGGCGHCNTRVLGFKFLGFLGDGFGVLSPSFVSHHQFLQPI